MNVRHELSSMEAAMKELEKARGRMKAFLLRTQHDVERRLDRSSILAATGGCPGKVWKVLTGPSQQHCHILVSSYTEKGSLKHQINVYVEYINCVLILLLVYMYFM